MTCDLIPIELTDEQKRQVSGILSVGCDRQTAADYIGCSLADIRRTMQCDSQFLARVRRAEASTELGHMRNVQEMATGEKKDWRASVWWLERRSPERFGKRGPGAVTARQLKAFVRIVSDLLQNELPNAEVRERVIARLATIVESLEQMLRDAQAGQFEPTNLAGLLAVDPFDGDASESLSRDSADFDPES